MLAACQEKAEVVVLRPQVEMLTNPMGIDAATPRFSWIIGCEANNVRQASYHILVASSPELLDEGKGDLWDSGDVASGQSVYVPYGGKPLSSRQQVYWKVKLQTSRGASAWSEVNQWTMGLLSDSDWKGHWVGLGDFPKDKLKGHTRVAARYLRKEFPVGDKEVKRATLYICGLGLYEAFINDERIGEQQLAPTPTNYHQSVKYNVFDVTSTLAKGHNAIGVVLGNGRYVSMRMPEEPNSSVTEHYGLPKLLCQLEVEYADGSRQVVCSDETWKMTVDGPIQFNNEYDGEEYDANLEMPGWTKAGFDDEGWLQVLQVEAPAGKLSAQLNPNIRVMDRIKPVSINEVKEGVYILDMGQNMVGWLQATLKGQQGDRVSLRFAELLQDDGNLYVANLRYSDVTDRITLKDNHPLTWHPTFVYHGFRYVEVKGLKYKPSLDDFEGQVLYDEMQTIGSFESSNPMLNTIYGNAYWGIRGNYRGMPTDCPQRDERFGWLGDRTTGCYGESYLFDNHLLYAKWLDDIEWEQTEKGSLADIAPLYIPIRTDNLPWPAAFLTAADMLYERFGDEQPIVKHYPAMKKWLAYMKGKYGVDGIITKDTFGDWCMPPERPELIHSQDPERITAAPVLATTFYYYLCNLMAKFASLQGLQEDVAFFQAEAAATKEAFNNRYYRAEAGCYDNNTVTANILPLRFGMVEEKNQQRVFENILRKTVNDFNSHVSTGVVGIQQLMRGLTDFGYGELALQIATQTSYPSWGYMVEHGATTIWELWNGNTADPAMNSANHVMLLGDLLIWEYDYLAGIAPAEAGFKVIKMRPFPIRGLDYVNASYESVYGTIRSSWRKEEGFFTWNITIPCNTTARVYVPCGDSGLTDRQKHEIEDLGSRFVAKEGNYALFDFSSGNYQIKIPFLE